MFDGAKEIYGQYKSESNCTRKRGCEVHELVVWKGSLSFYADELWLSDLCVNWFWWNSLCMYVSPFWVFGIVKIRMYVRNTVCPTQVIHILNLMLFILVVNIYSTRSKARRCAVVMIRRLRYAFRFQESKYVASLVAIFKAPSLEHLL